MFKIVIPDPENYSVASMGKNWKTYKKLHKWPGLFISFVLLRYGFTGVRNSVGEIICA